MSDIREDLKAFVDHELPSARTDEIADAVQGDPALQREVAEIETLSKEIRAMAPAYRPVGMEETLARVGAKPRSSGWGLPRLAWAGLAASVVLVGFLVFRGGGGPPESDASLLVRDEGGRVTFDKKAVRDPEFREQGGLDEAPIESAPMAKGPSPDLDPSQTKGASPKEAMRPGEPSVGAAGAEEAKPVPSEGTPNRQEDEKSKSVGPPQAVAPADAGSVAGGQAPSPAAAAESGPRDQPMAGRVVVLVDDIDKARAAAEALTSSLGGRPDGNRNRLGKNELVVTVAQDRVGEVVESLRQLGKVTQDSTPPASDKAGLSRPSAGGNSGTMGRGSQGGLGGGGGGLGGAEGGAPGGRAAPDATAKAGVPVKVTLRIVFVQKKAPSQNVP